jgi:CDP-diacylglycerol--serine O-phosphatidyltransferase
MKLTFRNFSLGRTLFILPNLFTLASTFCGFYSMLVASRATSAADFYAAAWLLGFAGILDATDGRVARLTKTESEFGLQLDSLSDAISFGIAPAWLFYHWGMTDLGSEGFGFLVAFSYSAMAIIRLARFNVIKNGSEEANTGYFVGLPSPVAAVIPALMVGIQSGYLQRFGVSQGAQPAVALLVVLMGLLMVSNIRFSNFRKLKKSKKTYVLSIFILGAVTYIGINTCIEIALLTFFSSYVAYHLALATAQLERRLMGRRTTETLNEEDDPLGLVSETENDTSSEDSILI